MKKFIVSLLTIAALCVSALQADAGRLGGQARYLERCGPAKPVLMTEIFEGGQRASVQVYGSDLENLVVTVTDLQGNVVVRANGDNVRVIEWTPEQTQSYRIVVTSQGEIESHVSVSTN